MPTRRSTNSSAGRVNNSAGVAVLKKARIVHHRDPVAEMEGLLHVVRDEHDGGSEAPLDRQQVLLRLGADDRIERAERFVHEQERRLGRERPRDADALLLAAREFMRILVGELRGIELEKRQQVFDPRFDPRGVPPEQVRHRGDVACDGSVRKQTVALDHVADPVAKLVLVDRHRCPSIDENPARRRRDQPIDHPQQGRFAGSGGADHDRDGAGSTTIETSSTMSVSPSRLVRWSISIMRALPLLKSMMASRMTAAAKAMRHDGNGTEQNQVHRGLADALEHEGAEASAADQRRDGGKADDSAPARCECR